MRPIDADKLHPDCLTKDGTLAISQSQIANAPTVAPEITNDDLQAAMTESYHLGYELAETKFKKPQGEWKCFMGSAYYGVDEDNEPIWRERKIYHCPFCNRRTVIKENYCPNCGADMRGGRQ